MPRQYTARIECVCAHCGKQFSRQPSQLKAQTFCGKLCSNAHNGQLTRLPAEDLFWRMVRKTESCWLWLGGKGESGHGRFQFSLYDAAGNLLERTSAQAHRFSWELANGPVDEALEVCHNCPGGDNPACINPAHLFVGTHLDNMRDASEKNQLPKGGGHYNSKLSDDLVRQIRSEVAAGRPQKEVAAELGMARGVISSIVNRKAWRHVE